MGTSGNIRSDPLFVNPQGGDFHLQIRSPCIDAGTDTASDLPDSDFDGEPRIQGIHCDMGADECSRKKSKGLPFIPLLLLD